MASFDFTVGSSAQRVCVADSDDRFEIWSVDAGEILPFRVDGDPVFVGGDGGSCAVVDVPGDYRIEFVPDPCGVEPDPEFTVGLADPDDVCCVSVGKDEDGFLASVTVDGETVEVKPVDPAVTYSFVETNPVDGDGIVVYTGTPSDGSAPQLITIAEPTVDSDTIQTGSTLVDGIVTTTFTDIDGNPLPDQTLDLSALISDAHPSFVGADGIDAVFDATTNEWTFSTTVVDTFATVSGSTVTDADGNSVTVPAGSTYNPLTNEITTSDGQVVPLMVDTDTFATQNADGDLVLASGTVIPLMVDTDTDRVTTVTLNADGSTTYQMVDVDNNPIGSPTVVPAPTPDVVTSITYGTAADGGDEYVNEVGAKFRINPRHRARTFPISNYTENNVDDVLAHSQQYTRVFANSEIHVEIHAHGDINAINRQPADSLLWTYELSGEVVGAAGTDVQRVAASTQNNQDADGFVAADAVKREHSGSHVWVVGANSADPLITLTGRFLEAPFYADAASTQLPPADVTHRLLSHSQVIVTEYEVL